MPDTFAGFEPGKTHLIRIPGPFFTELLPHIDDPDELKLTLFCFWALEQREGRYRYLRFADFTVPESPIADPERLGSALSAMTRRESLLAAVIEGPNGREPLYFLNTPNGRAAVKLIAAGRWQPGDADHPAEILPEPPNIFQLYEANIGVLTPLIADELRDAANTYPAAWIEEAVAIAVSRNARNWRYIAAILDRWHKEGKDDGPQTRPGINGADSEQNRNRFVSGKYADIIES